MTGLKSFNLTLAEKISNFMYLSYNHPKSSWHGILVAKDNLNAVFWVMVLCLYERKYYALKLSVQEVGGGVLTLLR